MSKSSLTRVATDIIKLHISHEHYMSKNEAFYMGRKQGDVNYSILFGEDIYKQSQFDSHLELTIPLPTKLLLRDNVDWGKIADDFIKEFGFVEKYGEEQVAAFIHYRDAESGRTKNENLHIHIAYVDRTVSRENLLYQSNKRPHAINLSSGTSCPKGKFKENALNHFKVEENTPVLNFELVDEELMDQFKSYFGRGGKKIKDEDVAHVKFLRGQIIEQAQSESIGLLVYSARQENKLEQLAFKKHGQQQRDIATKVLNNIINEYNLEDHVEEFGYYSSLTKKEKQDKRDVELDEREAKIPNEVRRQVDEQVAVKKATLIVENATELANEKTLQQNKINIDNVEVLKKLKAQQEHDLKAEKLKFEEEKRKKELLDAKKQLLQQIQLNELIEKTTNKVTEPPTEMFLIFEKNPNHNSLLTYSNSLVNLIVEKIKEPITDTFVGNVRKVVDTSAEMIFNAFNNMISLASKIGNQLADKTKELSTITATVKSKNDELTKVTAYYDAKNTELIKVTTDYNSKNTDLDDINKAIANKNNELNKMLDKCIGDIIEGKRKKLIFGAELDEHINLLFDDIEKNIPYGNAIVKISDYEFTFKYPEYVKQLTPLMDTMNKALVALKNNEGFEVEYSADEMDKLEDYYDELTR